MSFLMLPLLTMAAMLSTGCTGIFQHSAPSSVMSYEVTATATVMRVGSAECDI
ncbi:MAG: hypothetical protein ACI85K_000550, partial [Hyphomicrobiaceae bacterium]